MMPGQEGLLCVHPSTHVCLFMNPRVSGTSLLDWVFAKCVCEAMSLEKKRHLSPPTKEFFRKLRQERESQRNGALQSQRLILVWASV